VTLSLIGVAVVTAAIIIVPKALNKTDDKELAANPSASSSQNAADQGDYAAYCAAFVMSAMAQHPDSQPTPAEWLDYYQNLERNAPAETKAIHSRLAAFHEKHLQTMDDLAQIERGEATAADFPDLDERAKAMDADALAEGISDLTVQVAGFSFDYCRSDTSN
jgi:hypothetical protein